MKEGLYGSFLAMIADIADLKKLVVFISTNLYKQEYGFWFIAG